MIFYKLLLFFVFFFASLFLFQQIHVSYAQSCTDPGYCTTASPCCNSGQYCSGYCVGTSCLGVCVANPTSAPVSSCSCPSGQYCYNNYCSGSTCLQCVNNSVPTPTQTVANTGICGNGRPDPGESCCAMGQDLSTCCYPDMGWCAPSSEQVCGTFVCPAGTTWAGGLYQTYCTPNCDAVPRICGASRNCDYPPDPHGCDSDAWCEAHTIGANCGNKLKPNCGKVKCDVPVRGCYSDCSGCESTPGITDIPPTCGPLICDACSSNGLQTCHNNCGKKIVACPSPTPPPGCATDWTLCPYSPVGGYVQSGGRPLPNVPVHILDSTYSDHLQPPDLYPTTDASGHFYINNFVKYGDNYAVRIVGNESVPQTAPPGYSPPARTTTANSVYSFCTNRDIVVGSEAYECQIAGLYDCGGSDLNHLNYRCNFAYPTPTAYPTIMITGALKEYLGDATTCKAPISANNFNMSLIPAPGDTDITSSCTPTTSGNSASAYFCSVKFDNQANPLVHTSTDLAISTLALSSNGTILYEDSYAVDPSAPNACRRTGDSSILVNVITPGTINRDLLFKNTNAWFKLRRSSFQKLGSFSNIPPYNWGVYDTTDDLNTAAGAHVDIGVGAGFVSGESSTYKLGDVWGAADDAISEHHWNKMSYTMNKTLDVNTFIDYIKARKPYKTGCKLNNADGTVDVKNTICLVSDITTISNNDIPTSLGANDSAVLVVQGDVTIDVSADSNTFNPSKRSIAILSTGTITFSENTYEANGIFIGNGLTVKDTVAQTSGLKVTGNLVIANTAISAPALTLNRMRTDNSKPTLFMYYMPKMYTDLLPYLSTSIYDWTQTQ